MYCVHITPVSISPYELLCTMYILTFIYDLQSTHIAYTTYCRSTQDKKVPKSAQDELRQKQKDKEKKVTFAADTDTDATPLPHLLSPDDTTPPVAREYVSFKEGLARARAKRVDLKQRMQAKKTAENNKTNKSEQEKEYVSFEEGLARAKAKRAAAEKFNSGYISFEEGLARAKAKRAAAEKFKSGHISFDEGIAMRARAAAAAKRRAEKVHARSVAAEELENDDKYESFADRCIRLGQAILVE